jgi:hypothetical protein
MQRYHKTIILGILLCGVLVLFSYSCAPNLAPSKWIHLGNKQVDIMGDIAVIPVRPSKGTFSRLKFETQGSLEMYQVTVFFENGEKWSPNERFSFRQGVYTHVIELPGGGSVIKKVEFRFHLVDNKLGLALVSLYGGRD